MITPLPIKIGTSFMYSKCHPSGWADRGHDQVMCDPFFHGKSPLKHYLGDDVLFLSKHLEQNIGYFAFLALLGELIHHEGFFRAPSN